MYFKTMLKMKQLEMKASPFLQLEKQTHWKHLYDFVKKVCISQNKKYNEINQAHEALQLTTSMKRKTILR